MVSGEAFSRRLRVRVVSGYVDFIRWKARQVRRAGYTLMFSREQAVGVQSIGQLVVEASRQADHV